MIHIQNADRRARGLRCLILAAGKGSRLRSRTGCKPLAPVLGIPLIERVIRSAIDAGAADFVVVTGHQGKKLGTFLEALARRLNVPITPLFNEAWEENENGCSVSRARDHLREPFLLLMGDHLFAPEMVRALTARPLAKGEIALAVDGDRGNPWVDMEDVTRVRCEAGAIQEIGKGLADFNALDTGLFYCTPAIFDTLEESRREGYTSLTAAVRRLAAGGQARAVDTSGHFWIDVDSPTALKRAEGALLARLRDKSHDGPVSRYLNRPLSSRLSRLLVRTPLTPNQISLFSFGLALLAAALFARGDYAALALGGLLAQLASIGDGCDGEVARLKYRTSQYGGWFDAVLDRYADGLLLFGLTWHLYVRGGDGAVLLVGFMALIGSFTLSYTADKYDRLMRDRFGRGLRLGRDVRLLLIFLGAVFNQVLLILVVLAVVMNVETVRRLLVCRPGGPQRPRRKGEPLTLRRLPGSGESISH